MQPFRPEMGALLAELVLHVRGRVEGMTERMTEVLLASEPAYRELPRESQYEVRDTIALSLERGLTGLVGVATRTGVGSVAGAREVGRRRAAQGVPLEAVLRAYRLGGQVTWQELLAASRESQFARDPLLLEVVGSLWASNDVQCAAVAKGYRDEQRRLAVVDDAARQQVLDGLLGGRGGDPGFVRSASELLGVPLGGRLMAVVAPSEPAGAPTLADPDSALLRRGVRSVWGWRSGVQVGVVALGARRMVDVLGWLEELAEGPVGVSPVVEGAAEVAAAWRLADTAARTLPAGQPQVVSIDDRLPEALLSNSPEVAGRLVDQCFGRLSGLPDDERTVLLDTLAAFLAAEGSSTRAADALYCHRNTVMHRLRRVEQVTGRSVADPRSRLLWQLALLDSERLRTERPGSAGRRPPAGRR